MKTKKFLSALLALTLLASLLPVSAAAEDGEKADWADDIPAMLSAGSYAEGEILVAVEPAYSETFDLLAFLGLRESLDGETIMTAPVDSARTGEAVLTLIRDPNRTTEELLYALAGDRRVALAEPNYVVERPAPADGGDAYATQGADEGSAPEDTMPYALIPDLTARQWENFHVHTPGWPDGGNMDESVVVAVLDEPVDFSNPDLAPVAYTFTDEQKAALWENAGILCDDHGCNVVSSDGRIRVAPDGNPGKHGTHVAGTIGAAWDGHGVSGVASNAKLISVQLFDVDADGNYFGPFCCDIIRGFRFVWCANKYAGANIRVTNNSYGNTINSLLVQAAARAVGEEFGTVSVFAAGNSGKDHRFDGMDSLIHWDDPYVLVVAAVETADALGWYSDWNDRSVDLAAPGSCLLSAAPSVNPNYFPDADSVWCEDFEDASPRLGADVLDTEKDSYTVSDDVAVRGAHALKLTLDPEARTESGLYRIALELRDIPKDQTFRYLGLSVYGSEQVRIEKCRDFTAQQSRAIAGSDWTPGNTWFNAWMDLNDGDVYRIDPDTDTLRVELYVDPGGEDTIWIDAVGLGNVRVPYAYMSGTSMSTPMVAGVTAVLAAQTGLKGVALAELVCSKVRQTETLEGKVRMGGVFDFDAEGAVPPAPAARPDVPVYDTVYPLDFNFGDPFEVDRDAFLDLNDGYMTGIGNTLYYLPALDDTLAFITSVSRYVFAFDLSTQSWSTLPPIPEYLYAITVSMTAFDGKLVVFGWTCQENDLDGNSEDVEFTAFVYDPAAGAWTRGSSEGEIYDIPMRLTELDGQLYLIGGGSDTEEYGLIPGVLQPYDLAAGYGEPLFLLKDCYGVSNTQAVAHNGAIWIYDSNISSIERVTTEGSEIVSDRLTMPDAVTTNGVLGACSEGLILYGMPNADNTADTWMLYVGTDAFVPMLRKTTRDRIFRPVGTTYRNRVYVMGYAAEEEGIRFFRSNAAATLNVDPNACDPWYDSDPGPAPSGGETTGGKTEGKDGKTETPAVTYTDVPEDAWYASTVAFVTEKGWFEGFGDGTFRPEAEMDRAMAVQVLWKLAGMPGVDDLLPFDDVDGEDWFAEAVRWACAVGVTDGTGEGFDPDAPVTREQFATMIYRLVQLRGKGFEGLWSFRLDFPDAGEVSDWALEGMSWLVMNGVLKGMDGMLNPKGVLTRAQAAALMERVVTLLEGEA